MPPSSPRFPTRKGLNPMELKESIGNIKAWVKAHPWAAAGIIGAVILLAIYMARRVGSGSGSGPVSIDTGGAATDAGGGGTLDSLLTGGGYTDVVSDLATSASPTPTPSKADNVPDVTPAQMNRSIQSIPASLSESFNLPPSVTNPVLIGTAAALNTAGIIPSALASAGSIGSRDMTGDTHIRTPIESIKVMPMPTAVKLTEKKSGNQGGGGNKGGKTQEPDTPAMRVGKGRHFTGAYKGITYINGYPALNVNLLGSNPVSGGVAAGTSKAADKHKRKG
jgi:hypothetical protein